MATDARAGRLLKENGLLFSDPVRDEIEELSEAAAHTCDPLRAGYYLGLQIGWRAAQRFR
jgi:hypothetical protein